MPSPVLLCTSSVERDTFQKALKKAQECLCEEARRAGAAEALLHERQGRDAARHASSEKTLKVRRSISSSNSTASTVDVGSEVGVGSDIDGGRMRGHSDADLRKFTEAAAVREAESLRSKLAAGESQRSGLSQQVEELRAQLETNTQQLLELQQELQMATAERDKLGLLVADSAKVRAEQQVEISKLGSQVGALQRELGEERNAASLACQRAARFSAEKHELEVEYQSYREHHGSGDDHKLKAITDLNLTASKLSSEVECKRLKLGELEGNTLELQAENRSLHERLARMELQRIKMHNEVQELKGGIRVLCRLRPTAGNVEPALQMHGQNKVCLTHETDSHAFEFDRVLGPECSQLDVFEEVEGLVQSALDGYKVSIFAYGQTGSGKTHTMQGSDGPDSSGLIPRTLKKVFQAADDMKSTGWYWSISASFMEVYNEGLRDLLRSGGDAPASSEHVIIQNEAWGTVVTGMTCVDVTSEEQINALMAHAAKQRAVGATDANAASSRSHSIFAMYLKGSSEALGMELNGALHLVDLAGSERLDRSGATGDRLRETRNINKSLASLAHVFSAKAEGCAHVPFRNSKLTHLMEPCLSGHGKTLMLVNVQQERCNAHETLCSLRFARQVAQCNTGGKPRRSAKQLGSAKSPRAQDPPRPTTGQRASPATSPQRRSTAASVSRAPRTTSPPRRRSDAVSPSRARASDAGASSRDGRWK